MELKRSYTNEERLAFAQSHQHVSPVHFIHWSVKIGAGTVIGNDGFGYVRDETGILVKMPHAGNVVIGENVEIGSNTCIDRAVVGSTIISEGVKIDNLVHIAHGVKIGKHTLVVAGAVIGGSAEIGDHCFIGINASIKNKVRIGNNVTVGMGCIVLADVPDGLTVKGIWKGIKESAG